MIEVMLTLMLLAHGGECTLDGDPPGGVIPRADQCLDECHEWCEWPTSCIVGDVQVYKCTTHPSGFCCEINCCWDPLGLGCG